MKSLSLILASLLFSCYSSTVYKPDLNYTEAEVNLVFDREGFRGVNGWVWQMGTVVFDYNRYSRFTVSGWPEEVDMWEEWIYILEGIVPRPHTPR